MVCSFGLDEPLILFAKPKGRLLMLANLVGSALFALLQTDLFLSLNRVPPAPKSLGGKERSHSNTWFCNLVGDLAHGTMAFVLASVWFGNVLLPCQNGKLGSCMEKSSCPVCPRTWQQGLSEKCCQPQFPGGITFLLLVLFGDGDCFCKSCPLCWLVYSETPHQTKYLW